ncbi:MAG: transcription antitermination factor NusB [Fretibacterium sp.]|nr:transcription antitermination factor NusB [Fretibacterium sp.]
MDLCPWQDFETALELFLGAGSLAEAELPEVKEYCRFLARGAWDRRAEADELLLRVVTGWRPERMISVDRAILRLVIFEGFLNRKLPVNSAISEAVEIARFFGGDESSRFVNGVLARVVRHLFPEGE